MTDKTHYRKAFDSPYLSSADITEPITLTIARVALELDRTKQTKDQFNTAHFAEKTLRPGEVLKPMILNATNSKFMAQLTGKPFLEDWQNIRVRVWVDPQVKFGRDTVAGLRLSKPVDEPTISQSLLQAAGESADNGTAAYAAWWTNISPDKRKAIGAYRHKAFKTAAEQADARKAAPSDAPTDDDAEGMTIVEHQEEQA